jgi:glutaryl-CoA dehydrogenase
MGYEAIAFRSAQLLTAPPTVSADPGGVPGAQAVEFPGLDGGVSRCDASGLVGKSDPEDVGRVLAGTRNHCSFSALGHAVAAYDAALTYTSQRHQFGKPLASFQIVQDRLVKMLAEIVAVQLYCFRGAHLGQRGELSDTIASLAKMNNTRKARQIIAEARDLLGGNGILLENHVMRPLADLEAVHTYEGTETIQTLLVGRAITGHAAFV